MSFGKFLPVGKLQRRFAHHGTRNLRRLRSGYGTRNHWRLRIDAFDSVVIIQDLLAIGTRNLRRLRSGYGTRNHWRLRIDAFDSVVIIQDLLAIIRWTFFPPGRLIHFIPKEFEDWISFFDTLNEWAPRLGFRSFLKSFRVLVGVNQEIHQAVPLHVKACHIHSELKQGPKCVHWYWGRDRRGGILVAKQTSNQEEAMWTITARASHLST
jgi:hypothetical protein